MRFTKIFCFSCKNTSLLETTENVACLNCLPSKGPQVIREHSLMCHSCGVLHKGGNLCIFCQEEEFSQFLGSESSSDEEPNEEVRNEIDEILRSAFSLQSFKQVSLKTRRARGLVLTQDCPICIEAFQRYDQYVELRCGHLYHSTCIRHWLENNESCPLCRHKHK